MQSKLIEQILENYNSYKNTILRNIEDFSYRKVRYGVDFTVALYMAQKDVDSKFIQEAIRDTDRVLRLDDNLVSVIFDFAKEDAGFKAAENLLSKIEPSLFGSELFISVVNSHGMIDDDEQIRKAFDTLMTEIRNHFDDVPMSIED
ncbi:MAG: hypothetical protein GXO11_05170 [Epsilonproteobacteria bacterium]|nr:hypothetical protein [Campylobacterota bacterium]